VPGIGKLLSLGRLYEIHAIARVPRVQDCLASCRLGNWARASAGKRDGTSGTNIGQAPLQWAFAEAAVLFWRDPPAAQPDLARVENKHGQGTALPLLAQQLARAVYDLRKRTVACARETVLQCYGRGAAEPEASLANKGAHLQEARDTAKSTASVQAQAPRGHDTLRPVPLIGPPLALLLDTVRVANGRRVLLLTRA